LCLAQMCIGFKERSEEQTHVRRRQLKGMPAPSTEFAVSKPACSAQHCSSQLWQTQAEVDRPSLSALCLMAVHMQWMCLGWAKTEVPDGLPYCEGLEVGVEQLCSL
jgi:hypothetical protein